MDLSESIVLRFKYNGSIILVNVFLVRGLTWWWVAKEVLRLHLLSQDTPVRGTLRRYVKISKLIAPNKESLDLNQRILYYDVKTLASGIFTLLTDGPWSILTNSHLLYVYEFLGSAKDLNSLMRVSARFRKLFSSDEVWKRIPFVSCPWQGEGLNGSEDKDWQKIVEDGGLSVITSYRLRWIAHHTSRLKLFYGSCEEEAKTGLVSALFGKFATTFPKIRNSITVLSCAGAKLNAKLLMRKLHYLIPESATQYHLSRACRPLLRNGMLTDLEPSPLDCRSRNLLRDPGTRVECSTVQPGITFRRIGDPRLTFLAMELDTGRSPKVMPFDCYFQLTDKAIGNVLLLDFCEYDSTAMLRQLERLWAALQYQFGSDAPAYNADWEAHKSRRHELSDTPVLIFLAVDWTSWAVLDSDRASYTRTSDYRTGIQQSVRAVHTMLARLAEAGVASHRPRSWYIQPVDATARENSLNCGFFAGINWLLRAIATREQQQV